VSQAILPATWFITHYMKYQQYPGGFSAFALCQITIAQEPCNIVMIRSDRQRLARSDWPGVRILTERHISLAPKYRMSRLPVEAILLAPVKLCIPTKVSHVPKGIGDRIVGLVCV